MAPAASLNVTGVEVFRGRGDVWDTRGPGGQTALQPLPPSTIALLGLLGRELFTPR